jgi:serine/threonine-protein kinase
MGMQAMKVFDTGLEVDPNEDRFYEAFLLAGVSHPNIVRVFDANVINSELDQREFLTMELVSGGTLESFVEGRAEPQSPELVLDLLRAIALGLACGHAQDPPIVHRDVKPSNILVSQSSSTPTVKVADFGLARWINPVTGLATSAGTILYTPPEGFKGYMVPASDVYSLGLVGYQLLCECLPFRTNDLTVDSAGSICRDRVRSAQEQTWSPPSYFNNKVPKQIDEIIMTALSADLSVRYTTAGEFVQALENVRSGVTVVPASSNLSVQKAQEVHELVVRAFESAKSRNTLSDAVACLEEALEIHSELSGQFACYLEAWRAESEVER